MRILIATDSFAPKIDGVADTAGMMARVLEERGHRVVVAAPAPGKTRAGKAHVVRFPSMPCPLYPEVRLTRPWGRINRLVERFRPDSAIVLTIGPIGIAASRALAPSVRLVHIYTTDIPGYLRRYRLGIFAPLSDRAIRSLSTRSAITLCPTAFAEADLAARGHPRLGVWGRGVDTALFHPDHRSAETRARLSGGEPSKPLLLYVGRLAREKNLDHLYQAAKMASDARIAIVGDGPERDRLERLFCHLPAVFTGYLRGEELASAFASADVFVFPSTSETFGQVVLQAQAAGLPAIVAGRTAPAELVRHGETGLHFEAGSPQALASAISALVDAPERRETMARAAVAHAASYSWDELMTRLESLLGVCVPPVPVAV